MGHLQQKEAGQLVSAKEIAEQYGIPQELLAKNPPEAGPGANHPGSERPCRRVQD